MYQFPILLCLIILPINGIAHTKRNIHFEPESICTTKACRTSNCNDLTSSKSHLDSIPDYYQNDTAFGGFPDGGQMYCGPVAVSNSLMYLIGAAIFQDTFPNLQSKKNQHTLIREIASSQYIGTGQQGTSPSSICKGIDKFLLDNNCKEAILSYYGWRPVPTKYHKSSRAALTSTEKIVGKPRAAVWLNIGWYTYQKDNNQYIRTGGHWVTLIKFLHSDTPAIVVHDPATRQTGNDTINLTRLSEGLLVNKITLLPVSASGYYRFTNSSGRYGIIDGFITLEVPEKITSKDNFLFNRQSSSN